MHDEQYKKKLNLVSSKIDHWHQNMIKKLDSDFKFDNDFIVMDHSPSRFNQSDASSDEEVTRPASKLNLKPEKDSINSSDDESGDSITKISPTRSKFFPRLAKPR